MKDNDIDKIILENIKKKMEQLLKMYLEIWLFQILI